MTAFSNLLNETQSYEILASVHYPIAARMAVDLGFKYGMVGGSVASLSMLGTPDLMLLTSTELCDLVKRTSQSSMSMAIYFDPPLANKIDPPFIVYLVAFCFSR